LFGYIYMRKLHHLVDGQDPRAFDRSVLARHPAPLGGRRIRRHVCGKWEFGRSRLWRGVHLAGNADGVKSTNVARPYQGVSGSSCAADDTFEAGIPDRSNGRQGRRSLGLTSTSQLPCRGTTNSEVRNTSKRHARLFGRASAPRSDVGQGAWLKKISKFAPVTDRHSRETMNQKENYESLQVSTTAGSVLRRSDFDSPSPEKMILRGPTRNQTRRTHQLRPSSRARRLFCARISADMTLYECLFGKYKRHKLQASLRCSSK